MCSHSRVRERSKKIKMQVVANPYGLGLLKPEVHIEDQATAGSALCRQSRLKRDWEESNGKWDGELLAEDVHKHGVLACDSFSCHELSATV